MHSVENRIWCESTESSYSVTTTGKRNLISKRIKLISMKREDNKVF